MGHFIYFNREITIHSLGLEELYPELFRIIICFEATGLEALEKEFENGGEGALEQRFENGREWALRGVKQRSAQMDCMKWRLSILFFIYEFEKKENEIVDRFLQKKRDQFLKL